MDVSVCIVNLNAGALLRDSLRSLYQHTADLELEVIVVDNGSSDGSPALIRAEFPQVRLIENPRNLGFTHPTNQAMQAAQGDFVLLLNPDTLVLPGAVQNLLRFLRDNPEVGICGPKILNRDGSLQTPCRRGISRPWNTISYFLGLARLFPKSKFFSGYTMTYLDENTAHAVAGVSGACMLIRREVINQVGYFDERYFAYQEDADYCFQAQNAGWGISYVPSAQIIHYGGQGGSRAQPLRSIYEWHRSYYLFYRKNLARDYCFLINWLYYLAMLLKFGLALITNLFRREKYAGPKRG